MGSWNHVTWRVEGIHILLGNSITQESLVPAHDMLGQFYSTFEKLYGMSTVD